MVGVAYNPNNCAFITNQARNTNQFDENVPYSSNNTNHLVLWDFVEEKLYWVNSLTNIIEAEIKAVNEACDFTADINFVGFFDVGYVYDCSPTNGVAPYTYDWTLKAAPQVDFAFFSATNLNFSTLQPQILLGKNIYIGLLQCIVTDSRGCKTIATFAPYVTLRG